jgi:protein KTI12
MALVTIVGFPCCGKSTRASQIKEYLEKRIREEAEGPRLGVVLVDDDNSHVPRSTYDSMCPCLHLPPNRERADVLASHAEKPGRANLFSNLTRNLGPETIVICDSLNYIKGFRYQMYCAAREAHARVCTVSISILLQSTCCEELMSDTRYCTP